jgi:hypothetical protein
MLHWDVTAKDILTQYKFPHCWKQLNYIIRVQISVGQVSYFLIPVVSSFHKVNHKSVCIAAKYILTAPSKYNCYN